MPDISAINAGLTSIKLAIDITKELKDVSSLLKDAEAKLKLADLIEALSEVKIKLYEARDENHELKEAINGLQHKLDIKGDVTFKDGHYFLKNPADDECPGPFCTYCYSNQKKLILVLDLTAPLKHTHQAKYKCPECGSITK
ncbi:MAG: hypothetical protein Q3M24_19180 [Candidatus Electrothrix aestuarii]|uniref:Uncharacterized protein n=1 Tax=Candidatus Electrothrix aestuarii TaxID=3062594 RepID=A0AAU8LSX2_9BACT